MSELSERLDELGGDLGLVRALTKEFLVYSQLQKQLIAAALKEEDAKKLRDAAHQLKGASGYFANPSLLGRLKQLEDAGASADFGSALSIWASVAVDLAELENELRAMI